MKNVSSKLSFYVSALLFLALIMGLAMPMQTARAATITVCASGCSYTTIQAAVDAATDGDTINVASGTYNGTINMVNRHNLTIVGEDKLTTIIKSSSVIGWGLTYGTSRNTVVRVETSTDISLQNITIDLDLVKGNNVSAYFAWDSTGTLDNNIIKNSSGSDLAGYYYELGVYLRAPGYTDVSRATYSVTNNTFYNAGRVALVTHGYLNTTISGNTFYKDIADFGYAIEMGSESTGTISNNIIFGYNTPAASDNSNSAGIYIENCFTNADVSAITKNVTISNNEIYNSQWALYMGNEFDGYAGNVDILANITGNNFHNNVDGAVIVTDEDKAAGSSVTANFTNNTLTNNGGYGYFVYTYGDGDLTVNIQGGSITGHGIGVYMNDYATSASASSYNIKVETAEIIGNTTFGVQNEYMGATLDASPNWWGTATGPTTEVSGNVDFTRWCGDLACTTILFSTPPSLPSNFYGNIFDTSIVSGTTTVDAFLPGGVTPIVSKTIETVGSALVYRNLDIPSDATDTLVKDGGIDGDLITFKINGQIVGTGVWHSGTNAELNFATVTLGGLSRIYDSTQKSASTTTNPLSLAVNITYDGSTTAPTNAGSYAVVAMITAPNYAGSASGTLVIGKASSTTTLSGGGTFVYDSSSHPATVSVTGDGGLSLSPSPVYTGSCSAAPSNVLDTPCTASYTYLGDTNHNGSSGSTSITITPASATVTLSNLTQTYDGTPKSVTVTTNPSSLSVNITYNGSTTPPTNAGSYPVAVAITNPNYTGNANGTFVILAKHSLSLVSGWNLVSFNIQPTDTGIAAVLSSIAGKYNLVYAWNAGVGSNNWMKYDPTSPVYANNLSNLNETMGFWIHMTAAGTLNVVGNAPATTNISLSTTAGGWNLVAYPSAGNSPLPAALSNNGVGTDFSLVYAFHADDALDPWKLFDRTAPIWSSDLTELAPGWGYWVKVSATHTWTVPY